MEVWKEMQGWEGFYEVSSLGKVKRIGGGLLVPVLSNGYPRVLLQKKGYKKAMLVHRMVAICFIENPFAKPCVNHKDFDRANNCVENLEWVTYKENVGHCRDAGRMNGPKTFLNIRESRKGMKRPNNIYPFAKNIKEDFKNGMSIRAVANKYKLNYKSVANVKYGNSYKWL